MAQSEAEAFSESGLLAMSIVLPLTLHTATSLGVLDILASSHDQANLSAEEIAAKLTGAKNPEAAEMLDRVLRLLASFGVVSCSAATVNGNRRRVYGMLPSSRFLARNEDGVSLVPFMDLLHDRVILASWDQLKDAILEGGVPFERAHGNRAFHEYPSGDARFNAVYNKGMFNKTAIITQRLPELYEGFKHINRLVDVGGGLGVTISMITSKHPSIKGINFDLPHVIEQAPIYPDIEHVGGDMFESVPKGDAIFMKWILHDWSDDHCVKLLKNCYDATPEDGKVIVFEHVVSTFLPGTSPVDRRSTMYDLLMMTANPGGKERTEEEFADLATKAGFGAIKLVTQVFNYWVMEFIK